MGWRAAVRVMTGAVAHATDEFASKVDAFLSASTESVAGVFNLTTAVDRVGEGASRIPVSINCSEPGNTWVCSPHATYGRYSIEEVERWGHAYLTKPLRAMCRAVGAYLWHARVDDAVALNNWLLSTNLYPPLRKEELGKWIDEALDRWPRHALWFRSLNRRCTPEWLQALEGAGFILIPSRQVYLYDRIDLHPRRPQNLRRDLALLRATSLVRSVAEEWRSNDFERAARLYAQLYLEKYSSLNPHYSARFLEVWHAAGLLKLTGFRDQQGVLQAAVGLFEIGNTITAPIVGYATERPSEEGLYRLLMATVYEQAAVRSSRINLSAGAAQFKRLRGGVGTIEYSAVYTRHLPANRRRAVGLLGMLARRIGEPCMRRFKL